MRANRTGGESVRSTIHASPIPARGTVQGLGVTDALRVELEPCQLATCLAEIDELGHLAQSALVQSWDHLAATAPPAAPDSDEGLAERRYEVQVLDAMRTQVLTRAKTPRLCGPSRLVAQVVAGAAQAAAEAFQELLVADESGAEGRAELAHSLAVLTAWVSVYGDLRAVQEFSFDPGFDDRGV
jgi:hypothetical protein